MLNSSVSPAASDRSLSRRRARRLYGISLTVAAAGGLVVALALASALRAIDLSAPPANQLAQACQAFVLPDLGLGGALALALASLAIAVVGLAVRSAVRQARSQRRLLQRLKLDHTVSVGDGISVITDARPNAFCAGYLRPRIYVSAGAIDRLGSSELDAVLAHERHHQDRRDPLRICVVRTLSDALFFLPVLRRLAVRYEALAELAADESAVRGSGSPQPLAAAMMIFGERDTSVVGIAPERVDHLLGAAPRWQLPAALLLGAGVTLAGLLALAARTAGTSGQMAVNLPLVAAQTCMVSMTLIPALAGAAALLAARRAGVTETVKNPRRKR